MRLDIQGAQLLMRQLDVVRCAEDQGRLILAGPYEEFPSST